MNVQTNQATMLAIPQSLRFYHPNRAGNGAAMQVEPRFCNRKDTRYNCFFLELAEQQTAQRGGGSQREPATFNWKEKLAVKLDFGDICELLVVLEGRADKAGGGGNGLYHAHEKACTIITCQAGEKGAVFIGLSRKDTVSGETRRLRILLSPSEVIGLRHVLQSSLFFLAFHQHLFGLWSQTVSATPVAAA